MNKIKNAGLQFKNAWPQVYWKGSVNAFTMLITINNDENNVKILSMLFFCFVMNCFWAVSNVSNKETPDAIKNYLLAILTRVYRTWTLKLRFTLQCDMFYLLGKNNSMPLWNCDTIYFTSGWVFKRTVYLTGTFDLKKWFYSSSLLLKSTRMEELNTSRPLWKVLQKQTTDGSNALITYMRKWRNLFVARPAKLFDGIQKDASI